MTTEVAMVNYDLRVRQIAATAIGLASVESIFSDNTLQSLGADEDAVVFFWREIEREFEIVVTRAQRAQLPHIGQIVHYLKIRLRRTA